MSNRIEFPDVEVMLTEYLADLGHVVRETPADLKQQLAGGYVIQVTRVGGGESDNGTTDHPRVLVGVFAARDPAKPRDAHQGAEKVRTRIRNLPYIATDGRLDKGKTESGPSKRPWADPEVALVQCIFRIDTRP